MAAAGWGACFGPDELSRLPSTSIAHQKATCTAVQQQFAELDGFVK